MGNEDGFVVFLVYGFGVFWEYYCDNFCGLVNKGYWVYVLILIGFGCFEKFNMIYMEFVWVEFVCDFIVEVVK